MYSLGMRRAFSARHYLIGGDWGDENIEHLHNYGLELVMERGTLDSHGYLVDICELEQHLDEVVGRFQGKTLNTLDVFADLNPSIERLATVMHDLFRKRLSPFGLAALTVTLWEDDVAWTSYRVAL